MKVENFECFWDNEMDTQTDTSMETLPLQVTDFERFWGNKMDTPMDPEASKLQTS